MEEKKIKQPLSDMASMHLTHLGKIFSNLSLFFVIVSASSLITFLIYPLLAVLWIFVAIVSLGMVFVIFPGFGNFLKNSSEIFGSIYSFLGNFLPFFLGFALITSILSIIFLSLDRHEKHWGRIIFSAILILITLIGFISLIVGGLNR